MLDRDVPAIWQMKIKRLKRLGMTQFADLIDRHTAKVFFVQSKGKWFSSGGPGRGSREGRLWRGKIRRSRIAAPRKTAARYFAAAT